MKLDADYLWSIRNHGVGIQGLGFKDHLGHGADELVIVQEQALGTRQVRIDRALQVVMAQTHHRVRHKARDIHSAGELVMIQQKKRQRESKHGARDAPGELIVTQVQIRESAERCQPVDRPRDVVLRHRKVLQRVRKIGQPAHELVVAKIEVCQTRSGEARDRPRKLVVGHDEHFERHEVSKVPRDLAFKLVLPHLQDLQIL